MSIASAPEDLASSLDEDLENVVPIAQSELNVKTSKRKQKFSEKGKSFLKELRAKRKETAKPMFYCNAYARFTATVERRNCHLPDNLSCFTVTLTPGSRRLLKCGIVTCQTTCHDVVSVKWEMFCCSIIVN